LKSSASPTDIYLYIFDYVGSHAVVQLSLTTILWRSTTDAADAAADATDATTILLATNATDANAARSTNPTTATAVWCKIHTTLVRSFFETLKKIF
jgi:hypothetical protein